MKSCKLGVSAVLLFGLSSMATLTACPQQPAPAAEAPAAPEFDFKGWYAKYTKEVVEARDLNKAVSDYWSENVVYHNLPADQGTGAANVKAALEPFYAAFSDVKITIEDVISQGNTVVARVIFEGKHTGKVGDIEPTGKVVKQSITNWYVVMNGKVTDIWTLADSAQVLNTIKGDTVDCSKCPGTANGSGEGSGAAAPAAGSGAPAAEGTGTAK